MVYDPSRPSNPAPGSQKGSMACAIVYSLPFLDLPDTICGSERIGKHATRHILPSTSIALTVLCSRFIANSFGWDWPIQSSTRR